MKLIIGILACAYICSFVEGISESDLRRTLFADYDKMGRPVRNHKDIIPVRVTLSPVAVKDVDVKDSIVKLQSWLVVKWEDQFLTWEPTDFDGLSVLRVPATEVWRPDVALYNGVSDDHILPIVLTNVVIYHNGTVLWVPPFDAKIRCNMTFEPSQNYVCTALIGSWTHDVGLIDLQEDVTDVLHYSREHFHDTDRDWMLGSMTAWSETKFYSCCVEGYSVINFVMTFNRRQLTES